MSKVEPGNGQLTVIDEEGNERLCNILFTLNSDEFNKKYVVFYPVEELHGDDDEQINLMAAVYVEGEDGYGDLQQIETNEEWEMIENALQDFDDEMSDGCHCDECEGECDCDEEECDDHECSCHHHEEK